VQPRTAAINAAPSAPSAAVALVKPPTAVSDAGTPPSAVLTMKLAACRHLGTQPVVVPVRPAAAALAAIQAWATNAAAALAATPASAVTAAAGSNAATGPRPAARMAVATSMNSIVRPNVGSSHRWKRSDPTRLSGRWLPRRVTPPRRPGEIGDKIGGVHRCARHRHRIGWRRGQTVAERSSPWTRSVLID
jgi:hypothetical protein